MAEGMEPLDEVCSNIRSQLRAEAGKGGRTAATSRRGCSLLGPPTCNRANFGGGTGIRHMTVDVGGRWQVGRGVPRIAE